MKETTLEQFTPAPSRKSVELLGIEDDALVIAFPSWHDPKERNVTRYHLKESRKDLCNCTASERFKKRCWHLKFRPIIIKLFRSRRPENLNWLEQLELYGSRTIDEIEFYIVCLLDQQDEVWQGDITDLELIDGHGQPLDRRIIGPAFLRLHNKGIIEHAHRRRAEYKTRSGGMVWVWKRRN